MTICIALLPQVIATSDSSWSYIHIAHVSRVIAMNNSTWSCTWLKCHDWCDPAESASAECALVHIMISSPVEWRWCAIIPFVYPSRGWQDHLQGACESNMYCTHHNELHSDFSLQEQLWVKWFSKTRLWPNYEEQICEECNHIFVILTEHTQGSLAQSASMTNSLHTSRLIARRGGRYARSHRNDRCQCYVLKEKRCQILPEWLMPHLTRMPNPTRMIDTRSYHPCDRKGSSHKESIIRIFLHTSHWDPGQESHEEWSHHPCTRKGQNRNTRKECISCSRMSVVSIAI